MANYPISKMNKEGTLLRPKGSYCSDEYVEKMCDLYLRDEIHEDDMEMAFAYDIHCPNCHNGMLKQTARPLSYNELGLYRCPVCDKK